MYNDARIVVPVVVTVPSVVLCIPPLMILIPAALSFGAKSVPCLVGLGTVLAVALNFMVEFGLRVFNVGLAPGAGVGVSELWSGEAHEQYKHSQNRGC